MRFVMTFVWSFLLVAMLNYVAGSIANVGFDFVPGVIASVIVAVVVILDWRILSRRRNCRSLINH